MSTVDFNAILSATSIGEIEKPKPLPAGGYEALVTDLEYGTSSKKKTPYVRFKLEVVQPLEGVDEDELEAYGDVAGKKMKVDFYLTEASLFQLKDFVLNHLGMDAEDKTLADVLADVVNNTVGIYVVQEVMENGDMFASVSKTFNVEDAG